jgi:hypothetical protein
MSSSRVTAMKRRQARHASSSGSEYITDLAAEMRRNTRAEAAYRAMIYLGGKPSDPTQEQWSVPSLSRDGQTYTITHDLTGDGERYHCSCEWGQRGHSGCVHEMAARRRVEDRRAAMAGYDALYGVTQSEWE